MIRLSNTLGLGQFGLMCARRSWWMVNGGNQWSGWVAFLSFFKDVCKLKLDYSKFVHYQTLAELSGPRLMHKEFCIISERPEVLTVDATNRPHNSTGPFCQWADGSGLYALNGIRVPGWVVETPASELTATRIMKIDNVDARREALRKMGLEAFIKQTNGQEVDRLEVAYNDKKIVYQLLDISLGDGVVARVLKMDNPSIDAMHVEGVEDDCKTVKEALAWRNGFNTYEEPMGLT